LEQFDHAGGRGFEVGFAQKDLGVKAAGDLGDQGSRAHVKPFGAADLDGLFEPIMWWFHAIISFAVEV